MHNSGRLLAVIFVAVMPAWGQLEIGNDWMLGLNGNLGYAYSGSLVNGGSSHGQGLYGDVNLRGSFYNPNFLNFSVSPYFGRSQSNSSFGSLGYNDGVNAAVNLFGGSHFPLGISYGRGSNNTSEFGMPSSTVGLAQTGDTQMWGITWAEVLPNLPMLNVNYSIGDQSNEIVGVSGDNKENSKILSLFSTYQIHRFAMSAGFTHRNVDTSFSEDLTGNELPSDVSGASNDFRASVGHPLPLSGSFAASYDHTNYGFNYHDGTRQNTDGASSTLNGSASFHPFQKFSFGSSASYSDSVLGVLPDSVVNGAVQDLSQGAFRNYIVTTVANYQPLRNLGVNGSVAYARQDFLGISHSTTQYGGGINYGLEHRFLGSFSFGLSAFDYANQYGNNGMGFTGNLNFNRKINGWELDGNFAYEQNVQTLYSVYTTSGYSWVSSVRRRMANRTHFIAGYGGSHSGFSGGSGSSNVSERVYGTVIWHEYNLNGFYSKADGTSIFTPTGMVALPGNLPPGMLPANLIAIYGAKAVGANLGGVFMHKLTFGVGYSDSTGTSVMPTLDLDTHTTLYTGTFQYRLRKIYLNGGFTKLRQAVGTPGTLPVDLTTYYIGFTRWFNFF